LRLVLLTILLLASIGLQLAAPQVVGNFLDAAAAGRPMQFLTMIAALFFIVVVVQKALNLLTVYWTTDLGWAATNQLRSDLFGHTLRLDMGFHKMRTPGELIERIDGDVGNLAEYFSDLVVQLIGNGLLVIGVLVLLFREAWAVGLVALGYTLVMFLFLRLIQDHVVAVWQNVSQATAEMFGFLEERLTGTEDIRANGGEAYVMQRLFPLMNKHADLRTWAFTFGGITFNTSNLLQVGALVISLALAVAAFRRGEMTIGTVFLVVSYVRLLEDPLTAIRRRVSELQRAFASVNRISEFLHLSTQVLERNAAVLPVDAPTVQFSNVGFAYKDRLSAGSPPANGADQSVTDPTHSGEIHPSVLHDVTFTVPAGHVLGVLGRTGSGKTTLTRLLFRLYDTDEGAITLDDIDVRGVSLAELRRRVGMVTQDVQLFAATVRDNLTLFQNYNPAEQPISDDEILVALETLGLGEWYRALPDGLNSRLQAGGQGLSAGEAQLLAFTRVFLRDPRLVVLDEASSRLDPATESLLERAIDRLLRGRTAIIVAHRLRTVQRADDILILEGGRVREFGSRIALAADPNSRFYQLLQTGLEEVLA
jgi:ABC-type multidrug transport system fused ATPase/permease subunit